MSAEAAPRAIRLSLDAGLLGRVRVGTLGVAPVEVHPSTVELTREIERTTRELRQAHAGCAPAAIAGLAAARQLYRVFGIDPTKTRPSSEKLLRRILQGKALPRISNAVDVGNLLALRFLLPTGLYDAAALSGAVALRPGAPDEVYEGIAGQTVRLAGRPVLADAAGPFGNPTADSRRTAVTQDTTSLWMTVFAPASCERDRLQRHMRDAARVFATHARGAATEAVTRVDIVE